MDTHWLKRRVESSLNQHLYTFEGLSERLNIESGVIAIAEDMAAALVRGHKILVCGNGGSMAQADHFAEELSGRFKENRPALSAISLSNPSAITCIGNDFGFDEVFARQVAALGTKGDILLCLSTSGKSENVIHAARQAKTMGIGVCSLIGLPYEDPDEAEGRRNGECAVVASSADFLSFHSDLVIHVDQIADNTVSSAKVGEGRSSPPSARIQEAHLWIIHTLVELVEMILSDAEGYHKDLRFFPLSRGGFDADAIPVPNEALRTTPKIVETQKRSNLQPDPGQPHGGWECWGVDFDDLEPINFDGKEFLIHKTNNPQWFRPSGMYIGTNLWECMVSNEIEKWDSEKFTFIDIGANVGAYTFLAHNRIAGNGVIYAIEPYMPNYAVLSHNCGHLENVHCFCVAASDKPGVIPFYVSGTNHGGHTCMAKQSGYTEIRVPAMPMDAFGVNFTIVKIDVEGYGLHVYQGFLERIHNASTIIMEIHNTQEARVLDTLQNMKSPKWDVEVYNHNNLIKGFIARRQKEN